MRGGEICCALPCEVRRGQERKCLTVMGVSVPQRLHDRGKTVRQEVRVCEAFVYDLVIKNCCLGCNEHLRQTSAF